MKVLSIVGARPNFVKIASLVAEMNKRKIKNDIIHTGQHYDEELSRVFFDQLDIPTPNIYLGIGSGTHGVQTGKTMMKIEEVLMKNDYDLVLVVGDVNSTLAAALAAVKLHLPVAHVEAGYRSFDMRMPEEINRVIVDRISQFLFAPTENAVLNLLNEGIPQERIFLVGNIMIETLLKNLKKAKKPAILEDIFSDFVVLTVHRAENTSRKKNLHSIIRGVSKSPFPVIFPAHPRTAEKLEAYGLLEKIKTEEKIVVIPPVNYLEFQYLLSHSRYVLTDSGGIQEEAMLHKVPCITLRKNTERMVTLQYGANRLVGTSEELIAGAIDKICDTKPNWPVPPLWDKDVSKRIINVLISHNKLLDIPSSDFIL
ncbi:MAG: non-hydrolyzing UDP-N-acetylglucosamine 2-epimerase [Candidatus Methanofastidiosia archaeon]